MQAHDGEDLADIPPERWASAGATGIHTEGIDTTRSAQPGGLNTANS